MKVLSFSALKGGVGKTTILYNFGEFLVENNKVLLIDMDFIVSVNYTLLKRLYENEIEY